MDMEDVLLLTAGLLAEDERVAAQVRRQYKWFVVDEFQDVSPLQSALLDLWLGGRDELCVVGDPAQTIYSFAGADAGYLRDFPAKYPGTTSIELVRNYRSTPAGRRGRQHPARGVRAAAGSSCAPSGRPARRCATPAHPDEVAEAAAVAAGIAALRGAGGPLGEIAVLFRINAQSEAFEEALADRGDPLRRPRRGPVLRPARGPRGGHPAPRRRPLRRGRADDLVEAVRGDPGRHGLDRPSRPTARGQTRDRWESWQALCRPGRGVRAGPDGADLGGFVDDLDRRAAEQHAPVADGVTLATFHAAKGLEWDSVFLCGLQDGTLPITYADTPAAVEEERRLLYVGMTRARIDLAAVLGDGPQPRPGGARASRRASSTRCCPRTDAGRRRRAAQPRARAPAASAASRWRARPRRSAAAAPTARRPTTRRCSSGCASGARSAPRTDEVPAFVVFTDSTLELIAEHKPRTPEALLRITGVGPDKLAEVRRRPADTRRITASPDGSPEKSREIVNKWFAPYRGAPVTFPNQQPRTTVLARPAPDDTEGGGRSGQHQEPELDAAHVRLRHARLRPRPRHHARDRMAAATKGHVGFRSGLHPGDQRLESTDLLTLNRSAASRPRNPPGIRGLCVSQDRNPDRRSR